MGRFQWLIGLVMIAVLALVGVYAYNVGVAHGLAEAGRLAAAPGAPPAVMWGPRPWGFGFGWFPLAPLFFILFWAVLLRALFWRGGWYGHRAGWYPGVPPAFEEWHRRAHAQSSPSTDVKA